MNLSLPNITKEKILTHFTYAWWQYVLLITVAALGFNLAFTMTSYRSPRNLTVKTQYEGLVSDETQATVEETMLNLKETLLPTMEEISFDSFILDHTYADMQLTTWMSAGEGNIYIVSHSTFEKLNYFLVDLAPYIENGMLQPGNIELDSGYLTDPISGESKLVGLPIDTVSGLKKLGLTTDDYFICLARESGNIENAIILLNGLIKQ